MPRRRHRRTCSSGVTTCTRDVCGVQPRPPCIEKMQSHNPFTREEGCADVAQILTYATTSRGLRHCVLPPLVGRENELSDGLDFFTRNPTLAALLAHNVVKHLVACLNDPFPENFAVRTAAASALNALLLVIDGAEENILEVRVVVNREQKTDGNMKDGGGDVEHGTENSDSDIAESMGSSWSGRDSDEEEKSATKSKWSNRSLLENLIVTDEVCGVVSRQLQVGFEMLRTTTLAATKALREWRTEDKPVPHASRQGEKKEKENEENTEDICEEVVRRDAVIDNIKEILLLITAICDVCGTAPAQYFCDSAPSVQSMTRTAEFFSFPARSTLKNAEADKANNVECQRLSGQQGSEEESLRSAPEIESAAQVDKNCESKTSGLPLRLSRSAQSVAKSVAAICEFTLDGQAWGISDTSTFGQDGTTVNFSDEIQLLNDNVMCSTVRLELLCSAAEAMHMLAVDNAAFPGVIYAEKSAADAGQDEASTVTSKQLSIIVGLIRLWAAEVGGGGAGSALWERQSAPASQSQEGDGDGVCDVLGPLTRPTLLLACLHLSSALLCACEAELEAAESSGGSGAQDELAAHSCASALAPVVAALRTYRPFEEWTEVLPFLTETHDRTVVRTEAARSAIVHATLQRIRCVNVACENLSKVLTISARWQADEEDDESAFQRNPLAPAFARSGALEYLIRLLQDLLPMQGDATAEASESQKEREGKTLNGVAFATRALRENVSETNVEVTELQAAYVATEVSALSLLASVLHLIQIDGDSIGPVGVIMRALLDAAKERTAIIDGGSCSAALKNNNSNEKCDAKEAEEEDSSDSDSVVPSSQKTAILMQLESLLEMAATVARKARTCTITYTREDLQLLANVCSIKGLSVEGTRFAISLLAAAATRNVKEVVSENENSTETLTSVVKLLIRFVSRGSRAIPEVVGPRGAERLNSGRTSALKCVRRERDIEPSATHSDAKVDSLRGGGGSNFAQKAPLATPSQSTLVTDKVESGESNSESSCSEPVLSAVTLPACMDVSVAAANALIDIFSDEKYDATIYIPLNINKTLVSFSKCIKQYAELAFASQKKRARLLREYEIDSEEIISQLEGTSKNSFAKAEVAELKENLQAFIEYKSQHAQCV